MTTNFQGNPCWYELTTSKGHIEPAETFYNRILGWTFEDAGMEGFDYHLAQSDGEMIAGLMEMPDHNAEKSPFWLTYFAVQDVDAFVADAEALGAKLCREPDDVAGTGRFAVLTDPQGATFGILQPDMSRMSEADIAKAERGEGAFHPQKPGCCNWNELMSTDPEAAFTFYSTLFGWTKGTSIDMGAMGNYQLFQRDGIDIGGMMALGEAPKPNWLPYFGVTGRVSNTIDAIKAAGGSIQHGPIDVPGGMVVAMACDPQNASFAVTGPETSSSSARRFHDARPDWP